MYSFPNFNPFHRSMSDFNCWFLTCIQVSQAAGKVGWKKHTLESRLPGEISITSDADDTTLMAESEEELKSLLTKVKKDCEKAGLKLNI